MAAHGCKGARSEPRGVAQVHRSCCDSVMTRAISALLQCSEGGSVKHAADRVGVVSQGSNVERGATKAVLRSEEVSQPRNTATKAQVRHARERVVAVHARRRGEDLRRGERRQRRVQHALVCKSNVLTRHGLGAHAASSGVVDCGRHCEAASGTEHCNRARVLPRGCKGCSEGGSERAILTRDRLRGSGVLKEKVLHGAVPQGLLVVRQRGVQERKGICCLARGAEPV